MNLLRRLARMLGYTLWRWGCRRIWYIQVTANCPECRLTQNENLDLMAVMAKVPR